MAAIAGRSAPVRAGRAKNPPSKPLNILATVSGRFRRSQAASVITGQQVNRGGTNAVKAWLQRSWCSSSSERMAMIGPVSIKTPSATPEALHMLGIGAKVNGQALGRADQAE